MNKVRWAAVILLFFTGASGVIGGIPMIADPNGTPWNMRQGLLRFSPFHSYLIPGLVLLAAIGILALVICGMALLRKPRHEVMIAFEGCILLGWIVTECAMIRMVVWPHYLYGMIGIAMMGCGVLLWRGARLRAANADRMLMTR